MMNWRDSTVRRLLYRRPFQAQTGEAQAARLVELERCRRDPVHWINHWAMTYDPRAPRSQIPFDLFPKQVEFLRWLEERERTQTGGLVEKSRDGGVTLAVRRLCLAPSPLL
jgi:phage terminase large subunit